MAKGQVHLLALVVETVPRRERAVRMQMATESIRKLYGYDLCSFILVNYVEEKLSVIKTFWMRKFGKSRLKLLHSWRGYAMRI